MGVIKKHIMFNEEWESGGCDRCGEHTMYEEMMVSGDPNQTFFSEGKMWSCRKCGRTRKR